MSVFIKDLGAIQGAGLDALNIQGAESFAVILFCFLLQAARASPTFTPTQVVVFF